MTNTTSNITGYFKHFQNTLMHLFAHIFQVIFSLDENDKMSIKYYLDLFKRQNSMVTSWKVPESDSYS